MRKLTKPVKAWAFHRECGDHWGASKFCPRTDPCYIVPAKMFERMKAALKKADKKPVRPPLRCPECGNTSANGGTHAGCDWVYGRRGWRQLGVYDG